MKLADLKPQFMRTVDYYTVHSVDTLEEAQGIAFDCPSCGAVPGAPKRGHRMLIWFAGRGTPDEWEPKPRWAVSGTGYSDLSISPSINGGATCWHGFITDGEIR